jgi:RNA polymerase sigma factor (sigma-70 family)
MIQESESAQEKLARLISNPGIMWSPAERQCLIEWILLEDPYTLSRCALRFFRYNWPTIPLEEARDAFSSFLGAGLDQALTAYDPAKGQLGAHLRSRLIYHCRTWASRAWKRQQLEIATPKQKEDESRAWLEKVQDYSAQSEPALSIEIRHDVQKALRELPERHRDALMLFVKGRSYNDISEELGISLVTVKNWIRRSREQLRQKLAHLRPRNT